MICYCNFCKYFQLHPYKKDKGFCTKTLNTMYLVDTNFWQWCPSGVKGIHDWFGVDSEKYIEEYRAARQIHIDLETDIFTEKLTERIPF